ncbi:MAG: regulatory protein RecX [candidate division NC10 bacterium]|nr:regulatory protein RecX [candidate division NC10 bacterium]
MRGQRDESAEGDALRLLAIRGRSVSEVRERLLKRGFSQGEVEETLQNLLKKKYLNDQAFASDWARGRLVRAPVGRIRIASELKAKGVGEAEINTALTEVYDQADELRLASMAVQRRLPLIQHLPQEVKRRRLFTYLQRRGFPSTVILSVLAEQLGKPSGDDEGGDVDDL